MKTTYTNRKTAVIVLDACKKYPIGYAIGDHESPALIRWALRLYNFGFGISECGRGIILCHCLIKRNHHFLLVIVTLQLQRLVTGSEQPACLVFRITQRLAKQPHYGGQLP